MGPKVLESGAPSVDGCSPGDLSPKGKRKRKPIKKDVFRFGNYHHYYGYRLGKTLDEDPRLKNFQREWFEGKDCLDIGCNEGLITISIAQRYNCRSILGVDIDDVLIEKAITNLREANASSQEVEDGAVEDGDPRLRDSECGGLEDEWWKETIAWRDMHTHEHDIEDKFASKVEEPSTSSSSEDLLRRVKFRKENIIQDFPYGDYMKDGTFDCVLCLSVTKWIHLNWGDDGLIRLFAKIYNILRPDGILILEPQPWRSYKKKKHVSEVARQFFKEVLIRPTHFTHILLDKIGFRSYKEISTAVPGSTAGFDRSLVLYFK